MKVGSLFTGYGGLDIAVGGDLAWYAEIEPAACQVLAHHYPNVPNLGDITKIDWSQVEPVDVITGGYPCQPFSHAGNRKGKNDVRHLWPNVLDAIRAVRPRYAILKNVSGHLTLGFADVLADLAEIRWSCEWGTYRASDVGAPHRRERIFIVAYTNSQGSQGTNAGLDLAEGRRDARGHAAQGADAITADTDSTSSETRTGRQRRGNTGRLQPVERGGSVAADADNRQRTDIAVNSNGGLGDGWGQEVAHLRQQLKEQSDAQPSGVGDLSGVNWGKYAPAIRRWESVLERNAPDPVVMRSDKRRLNPRFVEWMMGLPDGWVTGHGLSAAKELKMLGNGVVPQQAHAAITQLLERTQQ
jgi:DNA (cytosine-5)-methyltransferase 1